VLDITQVMSDEFRTWKNCLLSSIILGGGLVGVEELRCGDALEIVLSVLAQGAMPGLKKLIIDMAGGSNHEQDPRYQAIDALVTAMESGHFCLL